MGTYDYVQYREKKRKDYEISEIETKYSDEDLSKLIVVNYVKNYPKLRYFPERKCGICLKNTIEEKFQLSGFNLCSECYQKEKEENFKEMLIILGERNIKYEGTTILENKLILGSIETSFLKDKLKSLGVTHILMIGYFMTPIYPNDFVYGNFEINDDTYENLLQFLVDGVKFIENSTICYCHCQLGKSRSASFVIAYIMYKNKIHFSEAFDFVKKKRRMILPNESFQCQLEDFDVILSNFDYDLDKCDEFIKKYLSGRDELVKKEKEYINNKIEEQAMQGRRKYSFIDYDAYDDDNNDDKDNEGKKDDDNNKEKDNKDKENKEKDNNNNDNTNNSDNKKNNDDMENNNENNNSDNQKEKEKDNNMNIENNDNNNINECDDKKNNDDNNKKKEKENAMEKEMENK